MSSIFDLRIEGKDTPLNIDEKKPRFSWKLFDLSKGIEQGSYQIIVSTASELLSDPDLWDSGRVESGERCYIEYGGRELSSCTECFWIVKAWDSHGKLIGVSDTARFRTGILERDSWKASWIGYDREVIHPFDPTVRYFAADDFEKGTNTLHLPPAPYLRKEISISKPVKSAIAYVSALGLYELHVNGEKIGDAYFTPGWSDYRKRVYYDAYELRLGIGQNVIGAILSDGWYAGYVGLVSRHTWGDRPRVLIQVELEYEDGTKGTVYSDANWQAAYGEIREADLLHGETADARDKILDWDTASCTYSCWDRPDVSAMPDLLLQAHIGPYNRVIETLQPQLISELAGGVFIYDVGKIITGFMRLDHINEAHGARVTFEFAEILDEEGDIFKRTYRSARATDTFVAVGSGDESFAPKFTFRGFRYIKISGLSRVPVEGSLLGMFVSSDLRQIGYFSCSNKVINSVFDLLKQTIHCGYMEVPMDCCERDERLGWGQDGNHSLRFGSYVYDISAFQSKWQNDILDSQKADGSVGPTAPFVDMGDIGQFAGDIMADSALHNAWILHRMYGDQRSVRRSYTSLKNYFAFMQKNSDRNMRNSITGDWLQLLSNGRTDFIHGWGDTARDLMGTAFYALGADIMREFALELGEAEDAERFLTQYEATRKAFRNTFELRDHHFRDTTQTGYALALYLDLLTEEMRSHVAKYLSDDVKRHDMSLTTGIAGSGYVLQALSENGEHDSAVRVMASEDYPGFGYMAHMGATSCWERWDSNHHTFGVHPHVMNSFSHIGLVSAGAWLFEKMGGIEPLTPGFQHVKLEPLTEGDVNWVETRYESIYGQIGVAWEKRAEGVHYRFTVPANVTATVLIPAASGYQASELLLPNGLLNGKLHFVAKGGEHTITTF